MTGTGKLVRGNWEGTGTIDDRERCADRQGGQGDERRGPVCTRTAQACQSKIGRLGVVFAKMPRENSSRPNPFAKVTSPSHRLPFSTLYPFPIVPSENLAPRFTRLASSSDSFSSLRSSLLRHPRVPHVLPCFEHRTPFRVRPPVFQFRPFVLSPSLFRENNSLVTARFPNAMRAALARCAARSTCPLEAGGVAARTSTPGLRRRVSSVLLCAGGRNRGLRVAARERARFRRHHGCPRAQSSKDSGLAVVVAESTAFSAGLPRSGARRRRGSSRSGCHGLRLVG